MSWNGWFSFFFISAFGFKSVFFTDLYPMDLCRLNVCVCLRASGHVSNCIENLVCVIKEKCAQKNECKSTNGKKWKLVCVWTLPYAALFFMTLFFLYIEIPIRNGWMDGSRKKKRKENTRHSRPFDTHSISNYIHIGHGFARQNGKHWNIQA